MVTISLVLVVEGEKQCKIPRVDVKGTIINIFCYTNKITAVPLIHNVVPERDC